jgi:glycosyltransferase involved in cell wall biosynthesis
MTLPWELKVVGGVNQVVFNLYRQFEAGQSYTPSVLINDWSAVVPTVAVDSSGIRVQRMRVRPPFTERGWLPLDLFRYLLALPSELRRIRAFSRGNDVRVVNCHFIGGDAIGWAIAKVTGGYDGKLVYSLHGLDIRTLASLKGSRRRIWKWALERADAIVCCSQGLADETIRDFSLSGRNVVTIHNGVRFEQLNASGTSEAKADRTGGRGIGPTLVNLGTFEHKKGHDLLLRALPMVLQEYPGVHLTILGRPSDTLESTRSLVEELGLRNNVTLGVNVPHSEAIAVLREADIFVLPSRNEAFSVALLEAGALGKPVVAAAACGVPELIVNQETGRLTPVGDVEALASGIVSLLRDPVKARLYGERLKERVLRDFTAEGTCRKYLDLMNKLDADSISG